MKLLISVVLPVLALLVVGALIGPNFVDWNKYKPQGQEQLKKHTGYDLVMNGDVRVSVFPSPHLIVRDARVKAPVKSRVEDLVTIKSLEVYVSLIPLLQGKVEVSAVDLIEPHIALEVAADGTPNWLTPEVKALQEKGGKDSGAVADSSKSSGSTPQISFDRVRVMDAKFQYYDAKSKSLQALEEINLDLSAESLQGPFDLRGDLALNGMDIGFEASVKDLDMEGKTLPLKLSADVNKNMDLEFSGVVDYGDALGVQGESVFSMSGLRALSGNSALPDTLSLKGFVSGNAKALSYKELDMKIGDNVLNGSLSVALSPILVQANLQAPAGLDLQPLIPALDQFGMKLNLAMVGQSVEFKNTRLDFDGQSVTLDGGYVPASTKGGRASANVGVVADALNLDKILVKVPKKAAPSETASAAKMGSSEVKAVAKSFALPLDLSVTADIGSLVYNGDTLRGVKVRGAAAGDRLNVKEFSVQSFAGAAVSVNGEVQKLSNLSGITANIALNSSDVKALANYAKIDTASFPAGLKAVTLKSAVSGDIDALDFTANITAMGGDVIAKGKALNALDSLALSGLVLQVKHPNMSNAIQSFAGGRSYPSLTKPLNFYAEVENSKNVYRFDKMSVDLAGTPVKGDLSIDMNGKRPKISGDVNMGDFAMVSAAAKAAQARTAAGQAAVSTARTEKDRWSSDAIDSKFLHAVDVDLSFAAKSLKMDHWALSNPSFKVALQNGTLDVQNLSAALYGGTMNVDAVVKADDKANAPISVSVKAKLRDVDIENLMTSLAAGSKLVKGKGKVSLDSEIQTLGVSQRAMVNALSGKGQVSGSNIVLDGLDLSRFVKAMDVNAKPGDTLLGLWKGTTKGGSTAFETLDGAYTIADGIVDISSMDLDGASALLSTVGKVDLPKWWIKTDHTIALKDNEEVPPFEMSFDGSLDNPKQTFAEGPLNDYLSKKISRKLEKVLSDKLGEKLGSDDALGKALGGLLGGGGASTAPQTQQQPAPSVPAPANDNQPVQQEQPQQQQAPQAQEIQPEQAIEGLLKGLLGQ